MVELVENNRADQVKLTDSDVEEIKNELTSNFIILLQGLLAYQKRRDYVLEKKKEKPIKKEE